MAFIFNGISSQSMKLYAFLSSWQIVPEQRNQWLSITGREGVLDLGRSSEAWVIRFQVSLKPRANTKDVMATLDDVAAWLSPDQGLKRLIVEEFPDRFFLGRVSGLLDYQRLLRTTGSFELSFTCPDPYGYALTDDALSLPSIGTYELLRTKGNAASFPTITISGEFTEARKPILRMDFGGRMLEVSGIFPTAAKLQIDTGLKTARFLDTNGHTIGNGMPALSEPVFPELLPGTNRIIVSGERLALDTIQIKANSRWR